MKRRFVLALAVGLCIVSFAGAPAFAGKPEIYTGLLSSAAVGGYDPVAYFTEGKPVEGKSEFATEWKGAKWYFASRENLDKFLAMPEAYAPQYGGYCAYGVAQGSAVKGDPELWRIVDGKLYLNYSKDVVGLWVKDIPGFIVKANANWPKVLE
jgi:YHS domain-containing protein